MNSYTLDIGFQTHSYIYIYIYINIYYFESHYFVFQLRYFSFQCSDFLVSALKNLSFRHFDSKHIAKHSITPE